MNYSGRWLRLRSQVELFLASRYFISFTRCPRVRSGNYQCDLIHCAQYTNREFGNSTPITAVETTGTTIGNENRISRFESAGRLWHNHHSILIPALLLFHINRIQSHSYLTAIRCKRRLTSVRVIIDKYLMKFITGSESREYDLVADKPHELPHIWCPCICRRRLIRYIVFVAVLNMTWSINYAPLEIVAIN